jgi:hypothetical protein
MAIRMSGRADNREQLLALERMLPMPSFACDAPRGILRALQQ